MKTILTMLKIVKTTSKPLLVLKDLKPILENSMLYFRIEVIHFGN